jgi:hypothetical protein
MMNGPGKSDSPAVPGKPSNKAVETATEAVEGRGLAKGSPPKRNTDRRVVRLIQKWLSAGVLEDGERTRSEVGTVQGGAALSWPISTCITCSTSGSSDRGKGRRVAT